MEKGFVVRKSVTIKAPIAKVWDGLTNPALVKEYLFGTELKSDWKKGSRITWKGVWQGKPYEDKGIVLAIEKERMMQYTYLSSMSGQADLPENYCTITIQLSQEGGSVRLSLVQDNNPTEEIRDHSAKNWGFVLDGMKKLLEQ